MAIELKVGPFEPEFAGKMDFYLNLLNEKERSLNDNPSIGIILCAEKDNLEVEFALKTKINPIDVAAASAEAAAGVQRQVAYTPATDRGHTKRNGGSDPAGGKKN